MKTGFPVLKSYTTIPCRALASFGEQLGMAFQAVDDLLGIWGRPEMTGKPVGNNRFYGANDPRRNTGLAAGY